MTSPSETAPQRSSKTKIADALVRLGRAVQRATIYPEGHPAVPGGVAEFIEVLHEAMEERATITIGIAVDRLLLDGEFLEERNGVLAWVAQHLHERGLGAIDLDGKVSREESIRFVEWLAHPLDDPDSDLPVFDGIRFTRFDFARVRFGEDPTADSHIRNDPVRIWQALLSGMMAGWDIDPARSNDSPEDLARELSANIARNEGIGASAVASRVIAMGTHLPQLPDNVRAAVKKRIGSFLAGLSPEFRTQLLRVDPQSSRQKLEFVTEMVDSLPDTTFIDILGSLDRKGHHVPHQFVTLMNKMISISARSPGLNEEMGDKLDSLGIPRRLLGLDPDKIRDALTEVLQSHEPQSYNPAPYQALLEDLATHRVGSERTYFSERYGDPREPEQVSAHVAAIAMRLLVADPRAPEAPGFIRRLEEDAPRALQSGRYEQVHEAASTVKTLSREASSLPVEMQKLVEEYLSYFSVAERIDKVLGAAEAGGLPVPASFIGLFRLCGSDGVYAALQRLAQRGEGPDAECLSALLVEAEPDAFTGAVARVRIEPWASLRVLFPILDRLGGERAIELALTFLGNEDPRVRIEAFRILLAADKRPGQAERYVERGLADGSPRVCAFAIGQGRRKPSLQMTQLLGALLRKELGGSDDDDLRFKAIAALAAFGTEAARDILINLLSERRIALFINQVRITSAVEQALIQIGDAPSLEAVHAWRRSAKRWMSMLLVQGKVETA